MPVKPELGDAIINPGLKVSSFFPFSGEITYLLYAFRWKVFVQPGEVTYLLYAFRWKVFIQPGEVTYLLIILSVTALTCKVKPVLSGLSK